MDLFLYRLKRFTTLLRASRRPEEERILIAGLGGIGHKDALPVLAGYYGDPVLGERAARSALEVVGRLRPQDGEAIAKSLNDLLKKTKSADLKAEARSALAKVEKIAAAAPPQLGMDDLDLD